MKFAFAICLVVGTAGICAQAAEEADTSVEKYNTEIIAQQYAEEHPSLQVCGEAEMISRDVRVDGNDRLKGVSYWTVAACVAGTAAQSADFVVECNLYPMRENIHVNVQRADCHVVNVRSR